MMNESQNDEDEDEDIADDDDFADDDDGDVQPDPTDVAGAAQQVVQKVGEFRVPRGYELWGDGTFVRSAKINPDDIEPAVPNLQDICPPERASVMMRLSYRPIWIIRRGVDVDSQEVEPRKLVEIGYFDEDDALCKSWVEQADLLDIRRINKLTARGLPMTSRAAMGLVSYFENALWKGARHLPRVPLSSRVGAAKGPGGNGWLIGSEWLGPQPPVVLDPTAFGAKNLGFGCAGDEQEWMNKLGEVCSKNSLARWLVSIAFAAPLLRMLNQRSFVVHHWGTTEFGKSSIMQFALTAFGNSFDLLETFNRTDKAYSEVSRYRSDFMVGFDELQSADKNADLGKIVYELILEKGRQRLRADGTFASAVREWKSIFWMNGEEPIVGRGQKDRGGQVNRVIEIHGPVLDNKYAKSLHEWRNHGHYGWGGRRFLERLVTIANSPPAIAKLASVVAGFRQLVDVDFAQLGARANHIAIISTAEYLMHMWLLGKTPAEAKSIAGADTISICSGVVAGARESRKTSEHGLQVLRDSMLSQRDAWFDVSDEVQCEQVLKTQFRRMVGVINPEGNEVWLVQTSANALLEKEGVPARAFWREIHDAGLLVSTEASTFSTVRRYGKFRSRVYAFTLDKFIVDSPLTLWDELPGDFEYDR